MYLLNYKKLINDFQQGTVTEHEQFKYFIAYGILWCLSLFPMQSETLNVYDSVSLLGSSLLFIGFCFYAYNINQRGDNKDFVIRYIALSVPIFITYLIISFGVVFVMYGLGGRYEGEVKPTDVVDASVIVTIELLINLVLVGAIRKVSHSG